VRRERLYKIRGFVAGLTGPRKRAFNTWAGALVEAALKRRALASFTRQSEVRALNKWRQFADERRAQMQKMHRAAAGLTSVVLRALNQWKAYSTEYRLRQRALGGLRHGGLKRGVNAWASRAFDAIEREERVRHCAAGLTSGLRKALNSWFEYMEHLRALRRGLASLTHREQRKAFYTWCEHLVLLLKKASALSHLMNRELSRGWRSLQSLCTNAAIMRGALHSLKHREARKALNRWAGAAEERENRMRVMRGTLYKLGDGHKLMKALNSWRALLEHLKALRRGLSSLTHREHRKAFNKLEHNAVMTAEVKRKLMSALNVRMRKAFNSLKAAHEHLKYVLSSIAHWRRAAEVRALRTWRIYAAEVLRAKRAMMHLMNRSLVVGFNSWLSFMETRLTMRAALSAFVNVALRKAVNTWRAMVDARLLMLFTLNGAAVSLMSRELRRGFNTWRSAVEALAPLKRAAAHWGNTPLTKGFNKLSACARERRRMRGIAFRLRNRQLSKCVMSWKRNMPKRSSRKAAGAFRHYPERKAFNSLVENMRRRRRLIGILNAFKGHRRGFNKWKSHAKLWKERRGLRPPPPPPQLHTIKTLTWRNCVSWLKQVVPAAAVSSSPPTLLRELKDGHVYQHLVHRISPAYYVRHRVEKCHENIGVFLMMQQFLDTDAVIRIVGCQKIDVVALEAGKAIEHLALVMLLKTVLTHAEEEPSLLHGR
jgi:protein SFI1